MNPLTLLDRRVMSAVEDHAWPLQFDFQPADRVTRSEIDGGAFIGAAAPPRR